jgi:C1A family cysteine protease
MKMRQNPNAPLIVPSRCFWYAESRKKLGDAPPLADYGSTNEATIWALANKGSLPESAYPYTSENMTRDTPPLVLSGGAANRLSTPIRFRFSSQNAQNVTAMQQALANGNSIVVAVMVYASFMTNSVMRTGIIPLPNVSRERLLGGHAICLTGYNANFFTFRNSWGDKVGKAGSFQIPKAYIGNWNLTGDAWIL